ncbi:hypothetical protein EDB83DRAFT_2517213 [Lactarius deliciosus]|nr:hypothetical protein EDB83DRAFT_2517213 [Lactarius deliciosus]
MLPRKDKKTRHTWVLGHTLREIQAAQLAIYISLGRPFDASSKLHGTDCLTLLDLVCSRLPTAELAILSACHTATMKDTSVADEALHLTSAVQHCRFRSMIETVQEIADMGGRDLAARFYTPLAVFPPNGYGCRLYGK